MRRDNAVSHGEDVPEIFENKPFEMFHLAVIRKFDVRKFSRVRYTCMSACLSTYAYVYVSVFVGVRFVYMSRCMHALTLNLCVHLSVSGGLADVNTSMWWHSTTSFYCECLTIEDL